LALRQMLEQERTELCGAAYERGRQGARRAGSTRGELVMGGRRVRVKRPRVRDAGGEVVLPSWQEFSNTDPLDERAVEQMVIGVSTRKYRRSLEALPEELESRGESKSAVSRRFVAATKKQLEEWLERSLSELDLAVVFIDGIHVEEHVIVIAVGVDSDGNKHVLGLWEGATENTATCDALLADLIRRGLKARRTYLFAIDGSKALRKAIAHTFGSLALVQRCQLHKTKNVLSHLPKEMHASIREIMREAYRSKSRDVALRRLKQLASQLDEDYPSAASSLREGLDETLTVLGMDLPPGLRRTLATTNVVENLNGTIRDVTRRVKRWRSGSMIRRWVGTAVSEAESKFRRVRGYRAMPQLVNFLCQHQQRVEGVLDAQQQVA